MVLASSIFLDDTFYSVGDEIFQQLKKERKNITNLNNLENKLLKPSKKLLKELLKINSSNKENLRQSGQICISKILYLSQITIVPQ